MIRIRDCGEDTLGTLFKTMRKERGMSQIEVSEKAGRNASDLCKHE